MITRIVHPHDVIPSQKERGVVEEISVKLFLGRTEVAITRTLWSRNKKRMRDQRDQILKSDTVLTLSGEEAADLVGQLAEALRRVNT